MTLSSLIVGSWSLRSYFERDLLSGDVNYPFGESPLGTITYTGDGRMSVVMGRPDLQQGRTDMFEMSAAEALDICRGFLAYCGTYSCQAGVIEHRVELASVPAFRNATQRRVATLERDVLTLEAATPIQSRGRSVAATIEWKKIGASHD